MPHLLISTSLGLLLLLASLTITCLAVDSLALTKRTSNLPLDIHPPLQDDALQLLDIVLLASVDGKFHALNRTSGHTLWSMASSPGAPATLGPLVRTTHLNTDPPHSPTDPDLDHEDEEEHELYIIEPQSGDIYVMTSPSSPLQRLAFSMSELVNMSPFDFAVGEGDEGDRRVFVGKKETALFTLELETGRVKEVNAECPWDQFEDLRSAVDEDEDNDKGWEIDLDELESKELPKQMTEISIGRTDYHIAIHTRPLSPSQSRNKNARKPPVQNLSFSTYGPNNRDTTLQASYARPVDGAYVQSFPNGDIFSFRTPLSSPHDAKKKTSRERREEREMDPLWHAKAPLAQPIVAVFDVLRTSARRAPFALLQPRPVLSANGLGDENGNGLGSMGAAYDALPGRGSAYVGLLEESGALFAMSAGRFPLVAFDHGQPEDLYQDKRGKVGKELVGMEGGLGEGEERCRTGGRDRRCLVGTRMLAQEGAVGTSMGVGVGVGLLDGAPPAFPSPTHSSHSHSPHGQGNWHGGHGHRMIDPSAVETDNSTLIPPNTWPWTALRPSTHSSYAYGLGAESVVASTLVLALVGAVWAYKRVRGLRVRVNFEFGGAGAKEGIKEVGEEVRVGEGVTQPVLEEGEERTEKREVASMAMAIPGTGPAAPDVLTPASTPVHASMLSTPPTATVALPPLPDTPGGAAGEDESGAEGEGDGPEKKRGTTGRKKRRGKKKKGGVANGAVEGGEEEGEKEVANEEVQGQGKGKEEEKEKEKTQTGIVFSSTPKQPPQQQPSSLIISDTILGFGSHGTVVFSGSLQGRAVAVKRLLQDFVTLASREVSILQESDDHPNVIRYYYQEAHANFLYIALELCPASLADIIECPDQFREIAVAFDPKRALRQIASGLRHLHGLKLVHRDIKPQNILVSSAKRTAGGRDRGHRMLISDFGLCKKLDFDQTSFLPTAHGAAGAGTVGWRAPEILRGEVKLDDALNEDSMSSRGSVGATGGSQGGTGIGGAGAGKPTRLTKLVDIFALGCLFYYTLTNGGHPFGDRFEREVNILKNNKSLGGLERFGEEGSEAAELISSMLSVEARDRPDTTTCLLHPFFWDQGRRLTFLQDASDRFEIMCRDPRDPLLVTLETGAFDIVGNDWHSRLDKIFIENLGKFRKYDGRSVQDLLRALRNKKHHYQDLPDNVKRHLGPMPEGFLSYFTRRYPRLFLHVHSVVSTTTLRHESMFRSYFDLAE